MSVGDIAVAVLLVAGVALEVLACAGVVAMRGVYDRLHYLGPASLGAVAIAAAIVIREGTSTVGFSSIGNKALLLAIFLLVTSPVVAHVTARAARIREHGEWSPQPGEGIEVEDA